jgi:hypothetical protein
MTNQEQPQLFIVPMKTLEAIVTYLSNKPFLEVVQIMSLIENTAKQMENSSGTDPGPKPQRQRRKPK